LYAPEEHNRTDVGRNHGKRLRGPPIDRDIRIEKGPRGNQSTQYFIKIMQDGDKTKQVTGSRGWRGMGRSGAMTPSQGEKNWKNSRSRGTKKRGVNPHRKGQWGQSIEKRKDTL